MRIVDPSGLALGVAMGLVEHGHRVGYSRPLAWLEPNDSVFTTACACVAQHHCGRHVDALDDLDADVIVLVDSFADNLQALVERQGTHHPFDARRPFAATLNPLVYPSRLAAYIEIASRAQQLVVIDCSDQFHPRETAFEAFAGATLLARECPRGGIGPWRPFPFLFNNALLALEHIRDKHVWWVPPERRQQVWDWTFAGTIDHARYGGRRTKAIEEVRLTWPTLRGNLVANGSFFAALRELQASRCALDLPGVGQLCFRLHESLTLGVPLFQQSSFSIHIAPGIDEVIADDPMAAAAISYEQVRRVQAECYSPRAAARFLLEELAAALSTA